MNIKIVTASLVFMVMTFTQGCAIYYKDLDQQYTPQTQNHTVPTQSLSYRVSDLPIVASDSGIKAIEDTLKASGLFEDLEKFYDKSIPNKGLFIHAEPLYKAPSIAAMGFGYLSASTLTILPAWSNHDGYKVRFTVFKDGEKVKTLEYKRERFVAIWIALLPLAWVNLFTSEEYDAFESITQEFISELPRVLK